MLVLKIATTGAAAAKSCATGAAAALQARLCILLLKSMISGCALQVRLCLDKKDYVRAQILSRKISTRAFVERRGEAKGDIGIEGERIACFAINRCMRCFCVCVGSRHVAGNRCVRGLWRC